MLDHGIVCVDFENILSRPYEMYMLRDRREPAQMREVIGIEFLQCALHTQVIIKIRTAMIGRPKRWSWVNMCIEARQEHQQNNNNAVYEQSMCFVTMKSSFRRGHTHQVLPDTHSVFHG